MLVLAAVLLAVAGAASADLNRWTSIGPVTPGGPVHAIRIHPAQSAILYAGTDSGVFVSPDAGQTWRAANRGLTSFAVSTLAIDPAAPSNLYAGTSSGAFKSADGGSSWLPASLAIKQRVQALILDPLAPWILYAATDAGVFQTTDAGASWIARNGGLSELSVSALAIARTSPPTILAGTRSGLLFRTSNLAAGWTALGGNFSSNAIVSLAIDPTSPATIYAGTLGSGVFRSQTGGVDWTPVNQGLGSFAVPALSMDPSTPSRLFAATSGGGIYVTVDGAASWTAVNAGLPPGAFVFDIAVDPADPRIAYAATATGLFRTATGGTLWQPLAGNFVATAVTALAFDARPASTPTRALMAGTAQGGLFTRAADSDPWTVGGSSLPASVDALLIDPATAGVVYAATSAGVFVSDNGGASWTPRGGGLPAGGVHALASTPSGILYAGTDAGIFKSVDGGRLWTAANAGLADFAVAVIAVDPRITSTLYAAGNGGVFRSTDGGTTWFGLQQGLGNTNIRAFAIDPSSSTTLYAGAFSVTVFGAAVPGGVYKSTDGGASWVFTNAQTQGPSDVQVLAFDSGSPATLYAATRSNGVFRSRDGAQTWTALSDGLANENILALAVQPGARVWASTNGGGVFELTPGGPPPCVAGPTTLCLLDNRFRVTVSWSPRQAVPGGPGQAIARTADTGAFWFFSNDNVELVVKVLDGRAFNGNYWVFFASLTNVTFDLTVTDTLTGQVKTYDNPPGQLASVADTAAFAGGAAPPSLAPAAQDVRAPAPLASAAPCAVSATALCLNDLRFRVQVSWQTPDGRGGAAQIVPMSPNSGGFWFFDTSNVELVLKILDGRTINGRFWILFGALSNVAYTVTVTDTSTGAVRSYVNPAGQLASVADTTAF